MTRRRRARHKGPPEPAFSVLLRALTKEGMGEEVAKLEVLSVWKRAVGPKIASRTQARSFTHGCLWVQAASPTWQNELTFLKATILAKVNALLSRPRVQTLRITCGTLRPEEPTDAVRRAKLSPTPKEVEQASLCAATIADKEVRAAFTRLMATDLRHRVVGPAMRPARR